MILLPHFQHNMNFLWSLKTITSTHLSMPVIWFNFRKTYCIDLEKSWKKLIWALSNASHHVQFQTNLTHRFRDKLKKIDFWPQNVPFTKIFPEILGSNKKFNAHDWNLKAKFTGWLKTLPCGYSSVKYDKQEWFC